MEHSAILSIFFKLPFAIKTFVLSIFEWPLKTGFTLPAPLVWLRNKKNDFQLCTLILEACLFGFTDPGEVLSELEEQW